MIRNMKRIAWTLAAALLLTASARAQDWKEALKKAAATAVDQATGGELTRYALVGDWCYAAPGVKFESSDIAAELGGAALETSVTSRLEKAYLLAGIRPGTFRFTFAKDDTFRALCGTRELSGTYEFDAATHLVTLHFAKGKYDLGSVPGHAYISGEELQLVFPVTRLVDMVTALGSRIQSLSTLASLLAKYENVYIGFRLERQRP